MNSTICEIWRSNRDQQMISIRECMSSSTYISIDTEFPGFLKETPINASDELRYSDMKFNVERTKLIQLGLTLLDTKGEVCGSWEVNFSDFDETIDEKNDESIAFLKRNNLNLKKIREDGISTDEFFKDFFQILKEENKKLRWITFHGSYDLAYILKSLTGDESLPETSSKFAETVERDLGDHYDVKKMTGLWRGMSSGYGLQRVADELQINRVGEAHHAGSDSELTARVYVKMALIIYQNLQKEHHLEEYQHHVEEYNHYAQEYDHYAQEYEHHVQEYEPYAQAYEHHVQEYEPYVEQYEHYVQEYEPYVEEYNHYAQEYEHHVQEYEQQPEVIMRQYYVPEPMTRYCIPQRPRQRLVQAYPPSAGYFLLPV